jgi:cytochrome P450
MSTTIDPRSAELATIPKATVAESVALLSDVILPTVGKGPIIRRPAMVGLAETLDLDTRAIRRMQDLRDKYGSGPLLMKVPGRSQAVLLDPAHVRRVLDETPYPFSTASDEKKSALSHFEPEGALISDGLERDHRRKFNELVLDHEAPVHRLAQQFLKVVDEEVGVLIKDVGEGDLNWRRFYRSWFRVVRRVVFGDSAREDHRIIQIMEALRARGNWAFLMPHNERQRQRLFSFMQNYVERAEPGSLAAVVADTPTTNKSAPLHQIPQWLFAFDPAGMTTFRALALLATHPEQSEQAHAEVAERRGDARFHLPFLRACILESLRLWPTTPMVLRQTKEVTHWDTGVMPADTGILIFAPFFHRDDTRIGFAHRFAPEIWLDEEADKSPHRETGEEGVATAWVRDWPLIPFSHGPGICPGRNVVLLLTSAMLAGFLGNCDVRLKSEHRLHPYEQLPGTLDNYSLRFSLSE